jgi:hypothetical protein
MPYIFIVIGVALIAARYYTRPHTNNVIGSYVPLTPERLQLLLDAEQNENYRR